MTRILVVDDYGDWRRQICSLLQSRPELQVLWQASDGLEAVEKAEEHKPDLILLDLGLPKLNGIGAARRIRQVSPRSKIIFLTQDNSLDAVEAALATGATGYVYKANSGVELLPAVDAVLRGERFVSSTIRGYEFPDIRGGTAAHRHEVVFYSDDSVLIESFTHFIAAALKAGHAVIVNVTKSHLDSLFDRLKVEGVDVDRAIQDGTYVSLNAAETLSTTEVNGLPDPVQFFRFIHGFIEAAAKSATAEHPRVALCGEGAGLLWMDGKTDEAIRLEQLCNDLLKTHEIDVLCAYPLTSFQGKEDGFQNICSEHSAVFSR